jgi:GNAT superfamily N-acetyltransferase
MKPKITYATIADVMGIATVHVKTWQATYKGLIPDSFLDNMSIKRSAENYKKTLSKKDKNLSEILLVAKSDGEVLGFAGGGKNRDKEFPIDGELFAIYLLPETQKLGLGKKLFTYFVKEIKKRNYKSLILWVLTKNPSRGFYEKVGGKVYKERDVQLTKDITLKEISYIWKDLSKNIKNA